MKFDVFIWDYDGTLFDTYDTIATAYLRAVQSLQIDAGFDELRRLCKHSVGYTAQQLSARTGVPEQRLLDAYYAFAALPETLETMRPYPGAPEALRAVCAHGGRNFLYSHRDRACIEALRRYGLEQCFSDAITRDDPFPRKPAPDALLYLIKKHGLSPARCVMVGDRLLDVEAGRNAGMAGALFDPENFCGQTAPTPYRYVSMDALRQALIEETN